MTPDLCTRGNPGPSIQRFLSFFYTFTFLSSLQISYNVRSINLKDSNISAEEFVQLDLEGADCVSCMHCKFTHEKVVPALDAGNTSQSRMNIFIRNAMKDIGKPIVDLSVKNDSHKFSVYVHSDKRPSFVHLTFNKRLNN